MVNKKHTMLTKSNKLFKFTKEDFSKANFVEGAIIRPAIQFIAFFTFIGSLFLLLIGDLKWGGSLIIFSFILNLYSIYKSLTDESSIYRTMNLIFKLVLFIIEIATFNYVLALL